MCSRLQAEKRAAKEAGKPLPHSKREPVQPRAGHVVSVKGTEIETLAPLRFEIVA